MTQVTATKKLNIKPSVVRALRVLSSRNGDMLASRYGIDSGNRQTLESIGRKYKITRERVRQIEEASYIKIRNSGQFEILEPSISQVASFIKSQGGVVTEQELMNSVVGEAQRPHLALLLTLSNQFIKIKENDEYKSSWAIDDKHAKHVRSLIGNVVSSMKKGGKPISKNDLLNLVDSINDTPLEINDDSMDTLLAVSKTVQEGPFGKWGLGSWPEVNPRGVRDKAYLVFDREEKPLHFRDIAKLIDNSPFGKKDSNKSTHPQTVHNELIKDNRFVLVGRGIYALDKWGYTPGTVKDVIVEIMKKEGKFLDKEAIVKKVLDQRMVQHNTIFLNLQNKNYFQRTGEGKYYLA